MTQEPTEAVAVLAEFDELVRKARGIPLTDQVRLDRLKVYGLLDRLRTALGHGPSEVSGMLEELDELVQHGRPIPLTNNIRVERSAIYDVLDRMRTTLWGIADEG